MASSKTGTQATLEGQRAFRDSASKGKAPWEFQIASCNQNGGEKYQNCAIRGPAPWDLRRPAGRQNPE